MVLAEPARAQTRRRAEESSFETKTLGKIYIIYFPGGKTGVKQRIVANYAYRKGA